MPEFEAARLMKALTAAAGEDEAGRSGSNGGIQLSITHHEEPFMLAVYESVRSDEMAQWGWEEGAAKSFLAMQYTMQQRAYKHHYPEANLYTVVVDGAPAGKLHLADGSVAVVLVDVALLPQYQGQGIGTALLRGLQRYAQDARKPLRLTANVGSRASRLYEKLAFRILEANEVHASMEWNAGF